MYSKIDRKTEKVDWAGRKFKLDKRENVLLADLYKLIFLVAIVFTQFSKHADAVENSSHLYFQLNIRNNNTISINFLFVKKGNEYTDPRTILKDKGRTYFRKKFLHDRTYYFTDRLGNINEITDIDFIHKEPYVGEPSYFYSATGKLALQKGKQLKTGSSEIYIASTHKKFAAVRFNDNQKKKNVLLKEAESASKEYSDLIFNRVKLKHKDKNIYFKSIHKEGRTLFADFDGDREQDLLVAWVVKLKFSYKITDKPIDIYSFPFITFVSGNGNKYITEDVGQRIEPLYRIYPLAVFDLDDDGNMDVLFNNLYYESNFYSVISGADMGSKLLVRTLTRYPE